MPRQPKLHRGPNADPGVADETVPSSRPESGGRADPLGVRRSVPLPDADVESAAEVMTGSTPSESDAAPAAEPTADTNAAQGKEPETAPVAQQTADLDGQAPPGRPRAPALAAAAIGGAVVLAIPLLLVGTGSHHHGKDRIDVAGNPLAPAGGQQPPGAFVSASASPTPATSPSPSPSSSPSHGASPKASPLVSTKPKSKSKTAAKRKGSSAAKGSSSSGQVKAAGVPSSERPTSGGAPYALEVHSPLQLHPGDTWRTNVIALTMQRDGNLVLRNKRGKAIWSSGTHRAGVYCEFQTDGNLVIYAGQRSPVWAVGTYGHPGATLVLQADANMVIFDGHNPIWATGT
jgi:hypothetical protein